MRQVGNVLLQRDGTVIAVTRKSEDAIARMRRLLVGGRSAEELLHERLEKAVQKLEEGDGSWGVMKQAPPVKGDETDNRPKTWLSSSESTAARDGRPISWCRTPHLHCHTIIMAACLCKTACESRTASPGKARSGEAGPSKKSNARL